MTFRDLYLMNESWYPDKRLAVTLDKDGIYETVSKCCEDAVRIWGDKSVICFGSYNVVLRIESGIKKHER